MKSELITEKKFKRTNYPILYRFKEKYIYDNQLNALTILPTINQKLFPNFFKVMLNFSLKEFGFNKKKALPFFLAVELLTNQKCVATISSKNVLAWKLRKDSLVGCTVSLRKNNLYNFVDTFFLALPRMEKFQPVNLTKFEEKRSNFFSIHTSELVLFYPIELGLGINTEVKEVDINLFFNTISLEEKAFLFHSYKIS